MKKKRLHGYYFEEVRTSRVAGYYSEELCQEPQDIEQKCQIRCDGRMEALFDKQTKERHVDLLDRFWQEKISTTT